MSLLTPHKLLWLLLKKCGTVVVVACAMHPPPPPRAAPDCSVWCSQPFIQPFFTQ